MVIFKSSPDITFEFVPLNAFVRIMHAKMTSHDSMRTIPSIHCTHDWLCCAEF